MPKKESIVYEITSLKWLTVAMPLLERQDRDKRERQERHKRDTRP